jgi:hypothetical protein
MSRNFTHSGGINSLSQHTAKYGTHSSSKINNPERIFSQLLEDEFNRNKAKKHENSLAAQIINNIFGKSGHVPNNQHVLRLFYTLQVRI